MTASDAFPPVFWLGDRSEGITTDFDGHVRRGTVLGVLSSRRPAVAGSSDRRYVWLRLDPALPIASDVYEQVVITERHVGADLAALGATSISVYVLDPGPVASLERGVFDTSGSTILAWADVALDPADLPETQEAGFDRTFSLVEAFVRRTGRAEFGPDAEEAGVSLNTWVRNVKYFRLHDRLPLDQAARLKALPGWQWYELDEFALLEAYARREGNSDVPFDHDEDELPLGAWVASIRSSQRHLPADWIERLEAIPHWHW